MEKEDYAEISINFTEEKIKIAGNQSFVRETYKSSNDIIEYFKNNHSLQLANNETEEKNKITLTSKNKYEEAGIYSVNDGEVKIHKKVSGKGNAEEMKKVAIISSYAKGGQISSEEIKNLCRSQACLDNTNFASTIKKDIEDFIVTGKDNSKIWNAELTVIGKERAEEILEEMIEKTKDKN